VTKSEKENPGYSSSNTARLNDTLAEKTKRKDTSLNKNIVDNIGQHKD
jgi:hypothetical protein